MALKIMYSSRVQLVISAVFALAIVLIFAMGIQKESSIQLDQEGTLSSRKVDLSRTQRTRDDLAEVIAKVANNEQMMASFRQNYLLQKDERIVQISQIIADLAKKHRISLEQVRYSQQNIPNQSLSLYRIEFPTSGTYSSIRAFIADLEQSGAFLLITQLNMESTSQSQGMVRVEFRLATFFEVGS